MSYAPPASLVEQMDAGPVLGPINLMPSALIIEQLCAAGFDFVWVDMEHGPQTVEDLAAAVPLCLGRGVTPIVRVPGVLDWSTKWVLDQGVRGVVFPFVNSAEEARRAISACKYPPEGHRGYFPDIAATRWGADVADYPGRADDEIAVILQIETEGAVEQIDEIAALDGWDVLFIGPMDLSASYGKLGQADDPEVAGAIDRVREAAVDAGGQAGILAVTPEQVRRRIDEGFRFIALNPDVSIVQQAFNAYADDLRDALEG
ncbi:MAG: aldolase/citrate lyase family protein [Armatimonadota bacterium]